MLQLTKNTHVGNVVSSDGWRVVESVDFSEIKNYSQLVQDFHTKYIWSRETIINNEKGYYVDPEENGLNPFEFTGDRMNIVAEPLPRDLRAELSGATYSSGMIASRGGRLVLKGDFRFSSLMLLPPGKGLWPALWLNPEFEQWPEGVEVLPEADIMEWIGRSPMYYYSNMHTRDVEYLEGDNETAQCLTEIESKSDLTLVPHRFGIERKCGMFSWFLDDVYTKVAHVPNDLSGDLNVIANLAIGGWPGDPLPETPFPARLGIFDMIYETPIVESRDPDIDVGESRKKDLNLLRERMHGAIDSVIDDRLRALLDKGNYV